MRLQYLLYEEYECVKVNGVTITLTTDEQKLYNKVKGGKLYKEDLPEYEQNVATKMVSKNILKRCKEKETGKIYYVSRGRVCYPISKKEIEEVAPPSKESEKWISKVKDKFKKQYGEDWKQVLYAAAWKRFNKSK